MFTQVREGQLKAQQAMQSCDTGQPARSVFITLGQHVHTGSLEEHLLGQSRGGFVGHLSVASRTAGFPVFSQKGV